ncbi:hypothetical protein ACQ4LE_001247 [Meloidogyne hapla]
MTTAISALRNCGSQCFVARDGDGKVTQGCEICPKNSKKSDCANCKGRHCNVDRLVPKQCWINDKDICKTDYDTPCFTERGLTNQINKGCGKCNSSITCKQCNDNRCNIEKEFPYFCKSVDGDKECDHSDCLILNLNKDNQSSFVYNCGKCPASNLFLLDFLLDEKLFKEGININNIQCAECKDSPLCNTPKFFEEQLFCWMNSTSNLEIEKGTRVCESKCFVSRDSLNGQLKFGCGECNETNQATDCKTCTEKYCNVENLVPKHCWLNDKEICKADFETSCYMERISINETKKGCGNCSTKACRKCYTHRCNDWEDIPHYCYSNNGTNGVEECNKDPDCYILKLTNKDYKYEFYQNCGKCPETNSLLNTSELLRKRLTENHLDEVQCADCNNDTLCNTEKFIEEKLFCLEKSPNESQSIMGAIVCEEECFVSRNYTTGYVTQGCGNCSTNDTTECVKCKDVYCNEENPVHKHCLDDNNEICKTPFDDPCYLWRTPTNGVQKGCGKCPYYTCKECNEHRCNNETNLPFYCFGYMASIKECNISECYIAKIEEQHGEEKIEQYHHDCGRCPSDVLDLSGYIKTNDHALRDKLRNVNMSTVQCAECKNSPTCNADPFFEKQLFCWEKESKKWTQTKGRRVCEAGCFIGVDMKEMGLVQGCGKCSDNPNLKKCENCLTPYCNNEKIFNTIKCHHLSAKTKPYVKRIKKCHPIYSSCYIAKDIFGRVEQNCGDCPSKYKNCATCKDKDKCNEESLLPKSKNLNL